MARNYVMLRPPDSHHHAECGHWCFGYACTVDRAARTAEAKCRTCRTDEFNRRRREERS